MWHTQGVYSYFPFAGLGVLLDYMGLGKGRKTLGSQELHLCKIWDFNVGHFYLLMAGLEASKIYGVFCVSSFCLEKKGWIPR